jgi:PAS domain S-box-containing protein
MDRDRLIEKILDELNIGVIFVDKMGKISYANKRAMEIRKMSPERIGTHVVECHPSGVHKRVYEVLESFLNGSMTHRHKLTKAGDKYFDNEYIALFDSNGEYLGIILTSKDVTEEVRLRAELDKHYRTIEEQIKKKEEEIEEKYREILAVREQLMHSEKMFAIGKFISVVAHEVNNPLDGIENCLRMIVQEPDNIEQTKRYAELALEAVIRIENFLRVILDYARPHNYEIELVDLSRVIKKVVDVVRYKISGKDITIGLEVEDGILVGGISHHLEQVFLNLLLNSIDAIEEKKNNLGDLNFIGEIYIRAVKKEDFVHVEVSDNGCGIREEHLSKIFSPFFTTKKEKGSGLGLYICYNIINSHGGKIKVESSPNVGTTFTVSLPQNLHIATDISGNKFYDFLQTR